MLKMSSLNIIIPNQANILIGLWDHTECMVPRFFIWIPEIFISRGPTPVVRLHGRTLLSFCGPCLSAASWTALHLASVPSNMAGLGVNGFVYFSRKKSRSAVGTNPGIYNDQN